MPLLAKRIAWTVLLLVTVGYVTAGVYLKLNERNIVFRPAERAVAAPEPRFALREERVTYPASGGVTLSAWVIPAAEARASGMWMLICHGNYGNIGFGQRPEFYSFMRDLGINLFAFDYRGYGESTGEPDERGLYDDATASYEYLTRTLGVPPDRIIIFGHSLGSGVAIELASRVPAAGLVVEAGYTSIVDLGQEVYPLLPIRFLATQRFPSIERIASITVPKLFMHSHEDAVIPYALGYRLYEAARTPKWFRSVEGGHDDAYSVDREVYFRAIDRLLSEVAPDEGLQRDASKSSRASQ